MSVNISHTGVKYSIPNMMGESDTYFSQNLIFQITLERSHSVVLVKHRENTVSEVNSEMFNSERKYKMDCRIFLHYKFITGKVERVKNTCKLFKH